MLLIGEDSGWVSTCAVLPCKRGVFTVRFSEYTREAWVEFSVLGQTTRTFSSASLLREALVLWETEVGPFCRELVSLGTVEKVICSAEEGDGLGNKRARLFRRMGFVPHPTDPYELTLH